MLPGPPYAITSTATRSAAMDEIYDGPHGGDIGFRKNAVAEVEDVARTSPRPREDVADLTRTLRGRGKQCCGLEIALDCAVSDAGPRGVQRNPPVDADDVATSRREVFQKRRGAGTEVNQRHLRGTRQRQRLAAVRLYVGAIVVRRETADPAVEQLQRLRPGARLGRQELADDFGELAQ